MEIPCFRPRETHPNFCTRWHGYVLDEFLTCAHWRDRVFWHCCGREKGDIFIFPSHATHLLTQKEVPNKVTLNIEPHLNSLMTWALSNPDSFSFDLSKLASLSNACFPLITFIVHRLKNETILSCLLHSDLSSCFVKAWHRSGHLPNGCTSLHVADTGTNAIFCLVYQTKTQQQQQGEEERNDDTESTRGTGLPTCWRNVIILSLILVIFPSNLVVWMVVTASLQGFFLTEARYFKEKSSSSSTRTCWTIIKR